jgi:colicin import membrane protein
MIVAPPMQHVSAGTLAVLVHVALLAALVFGMSWTSLPHAPVQADLWAELPEPSRLRVPPAPMVEPVPIEPPRIEPPPPPPPVPRVQPPAAPDIALEQEQRRLREERLREERAQRQREAEAARQREEEARRQADAARLERERAEQARREREQAEAELRELQRRQMEEEAQRMRAQMEADAARQRLAMAAGQARVIDDHRALIRERILDQMHLPPNLQGNPEVEYRVDLMPTGDVLRVTLVRSSGQPAYDAAVERAILRASPLPLPADRDVARLFRQGLILKFRPSENPARSG